MTARIRKLRRIVAEAERKTRKLDHPLKRAAFEKILVALLNEAFPLAPPPIRRWSK